LLISAATLDGYIRQILKDRKNNILEEIKKINSLSEDRSLAYDKAIEEMSNNTKNKATILKYNEAIDEHKKGY
jgi:AAA+ ATPase superfamily predicted ATPase